MFNQLNQELYDIKKSAVIKDKLKKKLSEAQDKRVQERKNLEILEKILSKEQRDLDRLESSVGLTSLFSSLLGSKQDKLNKEKQEAVAAQFKYETCKASLENITDEIDYLESEIEKIGDIESRYREIIKLKEKTVRENGDREYSELVEKISGMEADLLQVEQAVLAGTDVLKELELLIGYLKSAKGWGTLDMLGGGLVSTALKHSKIDGAKQVVIHVQQLLRRFQHELTDIEIDPGSNLVVGIDSFSRFADFFFDNLVFDWAVQSKIDRSLGNAQKTQEQVKGIVEKLKIRLESLHKEIEKAEEGKKRRVERA
ncbi:hypothetical protein JW935_18455 [candidate division KSB1 bacterium]|nr:hypothetical protein [candidate division KSB1 bacterium]